MLLCTASVRVVEVVWPAVCVGGCVHVCVHTCINTNTNLQRGRPCVQHMHAFAALAATYVITGLITGLVTGLAPPLHPGVEARDKRSDVGLQRPNLRRRRRNCVHPPHNPGLLPAFLPPPSPTIAPPFANALNPLLHPASTGLLLCGGDMGPVLQCLPPQPPAPAPGGPCVHTERQPEPKSVVPQHRIHRRASRVRACRLPQPTSAGATAGTGISTEIKRMITYA